MEKIDELIINQLKHGREDAFKYIYDQYYLLLCHIAKEYVGDSYLAESMVGDVIFHLWEVHANLDIHISLRNYLIKAVRNRCIDYLSTKQTRTEFSLSTLGQPEFNVTYLIDDKYPLGQLLEKELEDEIAAAIEKLPVETRNVFKKSRYEQKKYEEIATELGISVNTVKYHIKRALSELDNSLSKYLYILWIIFFT